MSSRGVGKGDRVPNIMIHAYLLLCRFPNFHCSSSRAWNSFHARTLVSETLHLSFRQDTYIKYQPWSYLIYYQKVSCEYFRSLKISRIILDTLLIFDGRLRIINFRSILRFCRPSAPTVNNPGTGGRRRAAAARAELSVYAALRATPLALTHLEDAKVGVESLIADTTGVNWD